MVHHSQSVLRTLAALVALPFASTGAAQNLIALTLNTPVIHQSTHTPCTALGTCPAPGLPARTAGVFYWSGGNAWDGTTNSLWASTGQAIARYGVGPCGLNFGPVACPKSAPLAEVVGMDVHEGLNQLWILDDAGIVTQVQNTTALTFVNSFATGLALAGTIAPSAIAIDELRGLVFYTTCDFAGGGATLHVAQLATPGAIFQSTSISICFGTLITGIAVHPGTATLYSTNGRETMAWIYNYNSAGPSVSYAAGVCCTAAPPGDPYIDLSIRWLPAVPLGEPCASGACTPCPMVHVLRNPPLLAANLQLGLDFAQPGIPVWCLINFGSCVTGGPVLPPLCGPLYVPLGALLSALGLQFTAGPGPCSASATIILPLPGNPVFLGTPLASQFVGLCPPSGTTMSNCLSWVIQ